MSLQEKDNLQAQEKIHPPAMVEEVQSVMDCHNWVDESPVCIDATLGTAGHTIALLRALPTLQIIAFDRDGISQKIALERLQNEGLDARVTIVQCDFRFADYAISAIGTLKHDFLLSFNAGNSAFEIPIISGISAKVLLGEGLRQRLLADKPWPVRGALLDAGMSFYQVSTAERGLSFKHNGPLDMRYSGNQGISAYELVNQLSEGELAELFFRYVDERWSRRIAAKIAEYRRNEPIRTTRQLATIVKVAIPAPARRRMHIHPATKVFAALRMAVNDEYWALEEGAWALSCALSDKGRLAILTYSSTEDRTVKRTFRRLADRMPTGSPLRRTSRRNRHKHIKRDSLLHSVTATRASLVSEIEADILPTDKSTVLTPAVLQEAGWGESWKMKILTKKPQIPSKEEIENNPLARSAKLRAIEKIVLA